MILILHVHVVDYIVREAEGQAGDEVAVVHLKKHLLAGSCLPLLLRCNLIDQQVGSD